GQPPARGDDDAGVEEVVADPDRGGKQAAGIVAQVQHRTLLRPIPGDQLTQFLLQVGGGVVLELADPDVGVAGLQLAHLDAADRDLLAHQVQVDQLVAALVRDRQGDLAAGLAAQLLEHLVDVLRVHQPVVDLDDAVARLDAGPRRRGIVDRRDDLETTIDLQHLDAQAAVLAGRVLAELLQAFLVKVFAVRVESRQHAGDRILHQGLVVDLFHVGLAHEFVDAAEIADLLEIHLIGVGTGSGAGRRALAGGRDIHRRRGHAGADGRSALRLHGGNRQQQQDGQAKGRSTVGQVHADDSAQQENVAPRRGPEYGRTWDNRTRE